MTEKKHTQRSLELHEMELERLRQMAEHNDIGLAAALHFCAANDVPPPRWLVIRTSKLLNELLRNEVSKKRGRAGGRVARYRQDLIDYERSCAVDEIRSLRVRNKEDLEIVRQRKKEGLWSKENERMYGMQIEKTRIWLRHGLYECASMSLRSGYAAGGVDAVKRSRRLVRRSERSPKSSLRYYLPFGDFLQQVGLEWPGSTKPGTKFTHFYDLTW